MSLQQRIQEKLQQHFQTTHLDVLNESHQHNVPAGSESHFKVVIVSLQFSSLNSVKRHQQVYQALAEEMPILHALSLHTYTPDEWQQRSAAPASPKCRGGSAKESKK